MPRRSRSCSRSATILATVALAAGAAAPAATLGTQPDPTVFHYTDCVGPAGTPETFDAVKLDLNSSGLHVVGSTSMWFLVHVESVATGEVFVDMPAAYKDSAPIPTITCLIDSPLRRELLWATGVLWPPTFLP